MSGNKKLLFICGGITLLCVLVLLGAALFGGSDSEAEEVPALAVSDLPPADSAYLASGEYAASAAWDSFRRDFDSDGSVFNAFLTGSVEVDKKYELYPVYSQEMADQLERIAAEYALRLHESISYFYTADELYAAAGTDAFLKQGGDCVGYIFDNGGFHFDGSAYLSGSTTVNYRFERQMRGILHEEPLALGGDSAQSWTLECEDGTLLHLALGESECIIHAALADSFVSITALTGAATEAAPGGLTAAALEELAACFDWTVIR